VSILAFTAPNGGRRILLLTHKSCMACKNIRKKLSKHWVNEFIDIHFGMVDTSVATDIVPEFGWITHFPFWAFYKGLY